MSNFFFGYSSGKHADPVPNADALVVKNLFMRYHNSNKDSIHNVSFLVPVGKKIALIGPNGSGKSSLLKTIAGLLKPTSGNILVYGNPVGACHHRVAYLPQRGEIDWTFPITVRKFVLTGRYVHLGWFKSPSLFDLELVDIQLSNLGLENLSNTQIGQLSGGQQQRILLARALVQESHLLLLDEPLNAIDAETSNIIYQLLINLKLQGKTLLVATHDLERLKYSFDDAIYLSDGCLFNLNQENNLDNDLTKEPLWIG